MNDMDLVVKDILTELANLRQNVAAVNRQVQRVHKAVNLDELEQTVANRASLEELKRGFYELTSRLDRLIFPPQETDFRAVARSQRGRELRERFWETAMLEKAWKIPTSQCPCGKHKGITFKNDAGDILAENMCPLTWWLRRAALAVWQGERGFATKVPLEDFMLDYALD